MCIVAAKYFKGHGWILAKNRDRNYKPSVSFKQTRLNGIERCLLRDDLTRYSEGINEFGIGVISAATVVVSDEKEIQLARDGQKKQSKKREMIAAGTYVSPDGLKIRKALAGKTVKEVVDKLVELGLRGNTLVADRNVCYLIEADDTLVDKVRKKAMKAIDPEWKAKEKGYEYQVKRIPKNKIVVRTNHGVWIEHAGYQFDEDSERMTMARNSSESRYNITMKNLHRVEHPNEMLDALASLSEEDPQMNPLRLGNPNAKSQLKTTGQILIRPDQRILSYRPVWCKTNFSNSDRLNSASSKTYVEVLAYPTLHYGNDRDSVSFKEFYRRSRK